MTATATIESMPLYARVREELVNRLISGAWSPGMMVPSEHRIAEELGVSQGTVRKALDAMAADQLLVRKQGRGTFVAEAEDQAILFKFYRLTPNQSTEDGRRRFPESVNLGLAKVAADAEQRSAFGLHGRANLWRLERLRLLEAKPILWEELLLPATRFARLDDHGELPNNLYRLFSDVYGVTVANVSESLTAVAATATVARHLGLATGAPLLAVERRAFALDGQMVELRNTLCHTASVHYHNTL